jgi:hypothetical protein
MLVAAIIMRTRLQRKRVITRASAAMQVIHRYLAGAYSATFRCSRHGGRLDGQGLICSDTPVGPSCAVPLACAYRFPASECRRADGCYR